MKLLERVVVVLALVSSSAAVAFAEAGPMLGTWKRNQEKSTYSPAAKGFSAAPGVTVKYETVQGGLQNTYYFTNSEGKPAQFVQGPFVHDGREYPIKGQANQTQSYQFIDRGRTRTVKENGKVIFTARFAVSADGKTLTLTQKGKGTDGKTVNNLVVFEKQ